MSLLVTESSSAGPSAVWPCPVRHGDPRVTIRSVGAFFPSLPVTSTVIETVAWIVTMAAVSGSGIADGLLAPAHMPARGALARVKERSGLTWEQLSRLMKVSPRSLHLWMDGKELSAEHEERLYRLLETVNRLPFEAPFQNRRFLLAPGEDGAIPFDLMVEGQYEAVETGSAAGPVRPWRPGSTLSPQERELRRPPRPGVLMDAMENPVHLETGKGRSIMKARRKS